MSRSARYVVAFVIERRFEVPPACVFQKAAA
jgi:hypothetical protein